MTYSEIFSYGFLYLSVLLLWLPRNQKIKIHAWNIALIVSIGLGLVSHLLYWIAIIPIIFMALAAYWSQNEKAPIYLRLIAGIFVIILSIGLAAHHFPGFHNQKVFDQVYISQDAVPFTFYLNIDKTLIGIFILGFGVPLISRKKDWVLLLKQLLTKAPFMIIGIVAAAYALGFIKWDPKLPDGMLIWVVTNLLFVCMAEEAFFRGFIQKNLALILKKIKYGEIIALLIAAILFGSAHYAGGIKYVVLATVAGLGYGWIYLSTKRIEGSILVHFGLNLTHFIFFTYPALTGIV